MHSKWFSLFQNRFLPLALAVLFTSCSGTSIRGGGGNGPGPAQTEFPPIEGTGGGTPLALKLNAELLPKLPREAGKDWVFDGYSDPITKEVAWSKFWTGQFDFTGVAWDNTRTLTMITPRHVVMAKHYIRPVGTVVKFHDKRGTEVARVLMGVAKLPGNWDVAVGILNEPVPSGVKQYKLPEPSETLNSDLLGALALVTDGERKVHVHECDKFPPATARFRFPRSLPKGFYEPLIKGDSGNPSFLIVRGEMVLIETHYLGGAGVGPFYGNAQIQEEIKIAISQLDPQFGGGEYAIKTIKL